MVILTHFLKAGLSNSHTSMTLLVEDKRFTGCGKLFMLTVMQAVSKPKVLITFDPIYPEILECEVIRLNLIENFEFDLVNDLRLLFIDSLESLIWKLDESRVFNSIKKRTMNGLGTVIVCNKSYMDKEIVSRFYSLAEICVNLLDFAVDKGTAKCVHVRGYLKNTEEVSGFVVEGLTVKERNVKKEKAQNKAHAATFRLDINDEEKKMKDLTPLPYEKNHPVINYDPNDYESPDEEGDDDDFY